jgi:hypothetical protein
MDCAGASRPPPGGVAGRWVEVGRAVGALRSVRGAARQD